MEAKGIVMGTQCGRLDQSRDQRRDQLDRQLQCK
jgi:hypothetical protein